MRETMDIVFTSYPRLSYVVYHLNEFVGSYQATTRKQIRSIPCHRPSSPKLVPTHHLFIDFKVVHVSIDHVELWTIMDENSVPRILTRLIGATIDVVQNFVKISSEHFGLVEPRRRLGRVMKAGILTLDVRL